MEPSPPGDSAPGTQDQSDAWAPGQEQSSTDPTAAYGQYPVGAYPPGYEYDAYAATDPYTAYYYGAYAAAAGYSQYSGDGVYDAAAVAAYYQQGSGEAAAPEDSGQKQAAKEEPPAPVVKKPVIIQAVPLPPAPSPAVASVSPQQDAGTEVLQTPVVSQKEDLNEFQRHMMELMSKKKEEAEKKAGKKPPTLATLRGAKMATTTTSSAVPARGGGAPSSVTASTSRPPAAPSALWDNDDANEPSTAPSAEPPPSASVENVAAGALPLEAPRRRPSASPPRHGRNSSRSPGGSLSPRRSPLRGERRGRSPPRGGRLSSPPSRRVAVGGSSRSPSPRRGNRRFSRSPSRGRSPFRGRDSYDGGGGFTQGGRGGSFRGRGRGGAYGRGRGWVDGPMDFRRREPSRSPPRWPDGRPSSRDGSPADGRSPPRRFWVGDTRGDSGPFGGGEMDPRRDIDEYDGRPQRYDRYEGGGQGPRYHDGGRGSGGSFRGGRGRGYSDSAFRDDWGPPSRGRPDHRDDARGGSISGGVPPTIRADYYSGDEAPSAADGEAERSGGSRERRKAEKKAKKAHRKKEKKRRRASESPSPQPEVGVSHDVPAAAAQAAANAADKERAVQSFAEEFADIDRLDTAPLMLLGKSTAGDSAVPAIPPMGPPPTAVVGATPATEVETGGHSVSAVPEAEKEEGEAEDALPDKGGNVAQGNDSASDDISFGEGRKAHKRKHKKHKKHKKHHKGSKRGHGSNDDERDRGLSDEDAGKDPEEAGPDLQRGDDSALGARPIYSSEERPRPMDSRGREIAADGIRRVIRRPDVEDRWEGGGGGEGRDRPVHRGAGLPGPPGGERDEGFGNGIRWGAEGAGREGHINRLVPGGGAPFQRRRFSRSPAARSTSPRCRRGPSSSPRGRKRSVSRSASPRNRLSLPSRDAGRRFTGGRWRRRHSRSLSRSRSFSRSRSRGRYRGGGRSRSPADKRTKEEAAAALAKAAAAANLASLSQQTTLQPLNMMNMQITRHARRAYVGCLPLGATEVIVTQFFNSIMTAANACSQPGTPVISVYLNHEKRYAFVEFRTVEEASNAMAFDGIVFSGEVLRIRRPHDYNATAARLLGPTEPNPRINLALTGVGIVNTNVEDGPNKVFVGGIPTTLSEDQVRELLSAFGSLKAFNLVMDRETGASKGFCFCEYTDPSVTDVAVAGLSAIVIAGKALTVRRSTAAAGTQATAASSLQEIQRTVKPETSTLAESKGQAGGASSGDDCIVRLSNMVKRDELLDDTEYQDILEETREEVTKYGKLRDVVIPKPASSSNASDDPPGVGLVFLYYEDAAGAERARVALHGRTFGGQPIEATAFSKERFEARDFS